MSSHIRVGWAETLEVLGLAVGTKLPAQTQCPVCRGSRLTVYQDTTSESEYHHCFDCGTSGDMIQLAAAAWGVTPRVAARKLVSAGVPIPVEDLNFSGLDAYTARVVEYRKRFEKFEREAAANLSAGGDRIIASLRAKFRLATPISRDRWDAGPGHMVGAHSAYPIERVFVPGLPAHIGRSTSKDRIFRGGGWKSVLVVPHHDLPGRLCGFLFVGRAGLVRDFVYKRMQIGRTAHNGHSEAGLGLYWAVRNSRRRLGDHLVACGDAMLALRLQVKNFATTNVALPLVSYVDSGRFQTLRAWRAIGRRTPVLWGWRMSASLINQAAAADGMLSVTGLEDESQARIDHFVRDGSPEKILRVVVSRARPWREALKVWADRSDEGAVEDVLLGLEAYPSFDLRAVAEISPKLASIVGLSARPYEVRINNRLVVETMGRWYETDRKGSLRQICEATFRVVGRVGEGEKMKYRVHVILDGHHLFTETPAHNLVASIKQRCTRVFGRLPQIASDWDGPSLIRLAEAFGNPPK